MATLRCLVAIAVVGGCISEPARPQANARHWTLRPNADEPGPMVAPRLAYDPDDGDVVMFAGSNNNVLGNAIYALGAGGWTPICTGPGGPSPRFVPEFTYDARLKQIIVAGGTASGLFAADQLMADIYECDRSTNTWTRTIPDLPSAEAGGGLIDYQGELYVIGGYTQTKTSYGVQALASSNQWVAANGLPESVGVASYSPSVAYDADRDRLLVYPEIDDGQSSANDLLAFTSGQWSTICLNCSDTPRNEAAFVTVPGDSSYLLAGYDTKLDIDVNLTSMFVDGAFLAISNQPPDRDSCGAAYDAARDVIVLYGGNGPGCASNPDQDCSETWELVR